MRKNLQRLCLLLWMSVLALGAYAGDNDLTWDYTETAPGANPDNGLYYASKVNDPAGTNNGLKGIKLNSSGWAAFSKAAVAGKLTLSFGVRNGSKKYAVDVYTCSNVGAEASAGTLIATTPEVDDFGSVTIDIAASVTGIYIKRNTGAEGVLSKIVFKEEVARTFVDFEINLVSLASEFDTSTLPSGVTFTGTYNSDTHGYRNATVTVPVDGTVKFTIGGCQYSTRTINVKDKDGNVIATLDSKTANCYHQDKSAITYFYTGDPNTLTFENIQYLPYFKAEATEVTEATVTYKDQNGKILGTKTVFEGDAIGEVPYTEADLTIPEGYKLRGWVYSNKVKVNPNDIVTGDITVKASVTAIESVTLGSVQNYELTNKTFYPEDHETFSVDKGAWHDTQHGFEIQAGGSFTVDVAGNAQIIINLCQYSSEGTITVTDANNNTIAADIAAKVTNDGTPAVVKYTGEATQLTFTCSAVAYIHKVTVYNVIDFLEKDEATGYYIVPKDDAASLLLAINSASAEAGAKIFLPNGTYDFGETVLTSISGTNVSLIGEDIDNTIIMNAPPVEKEGLGSADLLQNTGTGLYIQDLTLKNALDYYSAGSAGRAPTLHDKGTKTINKNVKHLSYQDTYYSHKTGGLYYFEGGELHGTVDYLCGNGKAYFNEVKIVNEKRSSATISANSELYVFNNCTVENNADAYNFGRAWSDNPVCIYLNTTLKDPSKLAGSRWNLTGINCDYSIAGEYGTKDAEGKDITPASNIVTFTKANTKLNTILDATALETYAIDKVLGTWAATAQEEAKQVSISNVNTTDAEVTWTDPLEDGVQMLCSLDASGKSSMIALGKFGGKMSVSDLNKYLEENGAEKLAIRAANSRGGFGPAVEIFSTSTGISEIADESQLVSTTYFNAAGQKVDVHATGVLLKVQTKKNGQKVVSKVTK